MEVSWLSSTFLAWLPLPTYCGPFGPGILVAFGKYGEESLVPAQLPAEFVCVKCVHLNVGVSGVCVGCSAVPCLVGGQESYSGERSVKVFVPGGRGADSGVSERAHAWDGASAGLW